MMFAPVINGAAVVAFTSRFQEFELTALGIKINGWAERRASPNACCPALGVPGASQFGLGTSAGRTTCTFVTSETTKLINLWGTVSRVTKPL